MFLYRDLQYKFKMMQEEWIHGHHDYILPEIKQMC